MNRNAATCNLVASIVLVNVLPKTFIYLWPIYRNQGNTGKTHHLRKVTYILHQKEKRKKKKKKLVRENLLK